MATATIVVQNHTGQPATIQFSHSNLTYGTTTSPRYELDKDKSSGGMTVHFTSGLEPDWWWVGVEMRGGDLKGQYLVTPGTADDPWTECDLETSDAGKTHTIVVGQDNVVFQIKSGSEDAGLTRSPFSPSAKIQHVFVLMLENRSFDHMLGFSRLSGTSAIDGNGTKIFGLTGDETNPYGTFSYGVQMTTDANPPVDPGHEFIDVLWQLCGGATTFTPGSSYPPIHNNGFVYDYVRSPSADEGGATSDYGKIMECYDTKNALPVLYQLAQEFAVCDFWFSSMPGPTWPNRWFLHGGSSGGYDDSPSSSAVIGMLGADSSSAFRFASGSIFDHLKSTFGNKGWAIYSDDSYPQVASIRNISYSDINDYSSFKTDIQASTWPYAYTFIEPNYGAASSGTFTGGNSQHPIDGVRAGEQLIKEVYESIRNSPHWSKSLLIVVYDEHGGFYDHVPPPAAVAPGDPPQFSSSNTHGFTFQNYGVRVPALVISPYVPKGMIDHTLYDHTSVLKTLEQIFLLYPLTNRDNAANGLLGLLSLSSPRTNAPTTLNPPAAAPAHIAPAPLTDEQMARRAALPIPKGNLPGFIHVAAKMHLEMSSPKQRNAIIERVKALQTIGDAHAYLAEVREKLAKHPGRRCGRKHQRKNKRKHVETSDEQS